MAINPISALSLRLLHKTFIRQICKPSLLCGKEFRRLDVQVLVSVCSQQHVPQSSVVERTERLHCLLSK